MAVFERNGNYYYEFIYDGQRIRESAKTTRKTIAVEAEKQRRLSLERSRAGIPAEDLKARSKTVARALTAYEKTYPINHRKKGAEFVAERCVHLRRLLGSLLPQDLTEERMKQYMQDRLEAGVSGRTINAELSVLSRALGHKFQVMWPRLRHLPENHHVGRALSNEEERQLIAAAMRSGSRMIGPIVRIALATGMRRDEIRLLRWGQIDFGQKQITVGRSKTDAGRGRQIPFGPMLEAVLAGYVEWYVSKLGAIKPEWHVFPLSNRTKPMDPLRPIGSFKTAWQSARKAASVKCRFHDLRHTLCTKLAEASTAESTMLAIMGHMSREMLERYSHIRHAAKREAMAAVEARSAFAFSVGVPSKVPPGDALGRTKRPISN
jgi:integrase